MVEDGGTGKQTVDAINAAPDQEALLDDIASIRRQYYTNLTIKNPGQIGNLKGWLNRVSDWLQVQV
ncbi:putative peptidoglycan-binding domain-containing protein [Paraburkholderia sp. J76]|uniref:putative peptidoglycan-binding domain-containing protein n=1 Tax=Paraburkholderia sp. J76 TaxID=2805439 RepID=UPI0039F60919